MARAVQKGIWVRLVNVLVVEDERDKREAICASISAFFGEEVRIDPAETFGEATQKIFSKSYDLIVMDLLLPRRSGDDPTDISEEMIEHLAESEHNCLTTAVAITRFEDVVAHRQSRFASAGIFLIKYSDAENWKACLDICMQRVTFKTVYDFIIVCALELERSAFQAVAHPNFEYGSLVTVHGLDARELRIGELRGLCILQPHMGLVDAAIMTTRALDAFSPKLICMAGICGGYMAEAPIGTIIVSDESWEHQAGKWSGKDFDVRGYREPLDNDIRVVLNQMIENDPKLAALQSKPHEVQVFAQKPVIGPLTSGSAVIASQGFANAIRKQHGKVAGIDMEVYGLHRAAALHSQPVLCFAAKTVVDHADEAKDNSHQQPGAILSARFVVKAIEEVLGSCKRYNKP